MIDTILAKLPSARRSGRHWLAKCPAHDDNRASLSITEGDNGHVLLFCHAGCPWQDIVSALGVQTADLFPPDQTPSSHPQYRARSVFQKPSPAPDNMPTFQTASEALQDHERKYGPNTGLWVYQAASGLPVGLVVRWDKANGSKDFRPISLVNGSWRQGGMPPLRPLYNLPRLKLDNRVYVVEGEKCADQVLRIGLTATTSPHGASSASKSDWSPLDGKEVIILPDNDAPGEQYSLAVQAELARLPHPPTVRVVNLPVAPGEDVVDWVQSMRFQTPEKARFALEAWANQAAIVQ